MADTVSLTGRLRHRREGEMLVLQVEERRVKDDPYGYSYGQQKSEVVWRDAGVEDFVLGRLVGVAEPDPGPTGPAYQGGGGPEPTGYA